jgi:hypothetical protein
MNTLQRLLRASLLSNLLLLLNLPIAAQQAAGSASYSLETSPKTIDSVEKARNRGPRVLIAVDLLPDLVAGLVHSRFTSR